MEHIEAALEAAAVELIGPLRQGMGLDEKAANRLKQALRTAAQEWMNAETISKSTANLFIDLANGIGACGDAYGGEEGERIKAIADEVADLVRACVAHP